MIYSYSVHKSRSNASNILKANMTHRTQHEKSDGLYLKRNIRSNGSVTQHMLFLVRDAQLFKIYMHDFRTSAK